MSNTIDQRVVEMRFDNQNFERNVSTTMSTLDKLKQKLNLSGASKGLEDINSASKRVDMSGLGAAVDTVKTKFSALDVVAVTALANITNSALNAGKRLISSLSVDQVTAGWQKFADKTTSVATLVAQGNAIEDVNEQLDRLNWFTDETSYNFTDMVSNIAKFTATGKGLEDSVTAMEGIATWAALSGQNATTASRAMYQLSQAMGSGLMRKEDYKSIQNASMDTEEFRKKCIEAGIALGTLKDNGDGTFKSLKANIKDGNFTISQFADHLTEDMWLTSDVMMQVFNEYSSAVSTIYDAAEEKGMLASEVIDQIHTKADELKTDTMSDSEAIDAAIKELGYTLEDGSLRFDSFGLKAFEAAQKARTFRDAIDSVKDAVSTGWMNTFELIFGDAEGATELWTDVANQLWDIFAGGSERRNSILENTMVSGWDKLVERVKDAGVETDAFEKKVKECAKDGGVNVDKLVEKYGSLSEAFKNGAIDTNYLKTAFDSFKTGAEKTTNVIDKLSVSLDDIFTDKNGKSQMGLWDNDAESVKKVQTALTELGFTLDKFGVDGLFGPETQSRLKEFQKSVGLEETGIVDQKTIDALKKAGQTIEEVGTKSIDAEASIDDLLDTINRPSGRELVFDIIHNSLEAISTVLGTFRSAWADIFSEDRVSSGLYNVLSMLANFSEHLIMSEETADKFGRTLKGLIAIFDVVTSILGSGVKFAFKALSTVLKAFDLNILDITANIGDMLVAFRDWVLGENMIGRAFDWLLSKFSNGITQIKEWFNGLIESFKETEIFKTISDAFDEFLDKLKLFKNGEINFSELIESLQKFADTALNSIPIVKQWIETFNGWIASFKELPAVKQLVSAINAITDAFRKLTSGEIDIAAFGTALGENLAKALMALPDIVRQVGSGLVSAAQQIGSDFIAGFQNGIGASVTSIIGKIVEFCSNFVAAFKAALGVASPSVIAYAIGVFFIAGFINGLMDSEGSIIGAFKSLGEGIVKIFKSFVDYLTDESGNIEWGKIIAGGISISSLVILNKFANSFSKIADTLTSFSDIFKGVKKVLDTFSDTLKHFSKTLDSISWDFKAKALLKMAASIAILVAAVWVLTQIDDIGKLWNAVGVIVVLSAVLFALALAMSKLSSASIEVNKGGANIKGLQSSLIQIGIALLLVAAVVKIIGGMDPDAAKQGFIRLAGLAVGLIVFLAAIGGIARYSGDVSKLGGMMIKISAALILLAIAMKIIAKMNPGDIVIGIAVLEAFVLFCVQLGIANRLAGQNGQKFGGNVLKIAAAMAILVIVMKMLAEMDPADVLKGIAVLEAFVILIAEMAIINRLAGSGKSKIGGAVLSMASSMMILAGVIWMLSKMDESAVDNGIRVLQKFVLLIAEMTLVSQLGRGSTNIAANMLAMATAIGILAGIAVVLSFIDIGALAKGIVAVGMLGAIMALMIWATRGANDVKGNLIAMTVAIGIMAAAVVALSFIDGSKLAGAVAAIGSLMIVFGLMTKLVSTAQMSKSTAGAIGAMIGVVIVLTGVIFLLSKLDSKTALPNAIALSILLTAFSASLYIMSKANAISKSAIPGIVAMGVILAEVAIILGVLGGLGIEASIPTAIALGILLNALAASVVVLGFAKADVSSAIPAVLAMGLVLAEIAVVLGLLSAFNITPSIETAVSLSTLLLALSAACVLVSFVPSAAAIDGALGLAAFIGIMGGVVTALGLLMKIPGFDAVLADGGKALGLIGQAIGSFVGGIAGGVVSGVGSALTGLLPELGQALSDFATNVEPFMSFVSGIDASAIAGVGILAGAILALTAVDFIAGIADLMTLGAGSFGSIGSQLAEFATGAKNFVDVVQGIDPSAADSVNSLAEMILALTATDILSGLKQFFGGGSLDFETLGTQLQTFGEAVVGFSNTISGKIDPSAIQAATDAGNMLVALNQSLPRSGGFVQDIIGEKDFGQFAASCKAFAECMIEINSSISGSDFAVQSDKISQLVAAGTQFSDLNNALPRSGGIAQDLAGEQDLAAFGIACSAFARCMVEINNSISGSDFIVQSDKLSKLADAGTQFSDLNNALPRSGGIAQDLAGEQDLVAFGSACSAFAECMIGINSIINQEGFSVNLEAMDQLKQAGEKLNELQGVLPKSGGWVQDILGEQDIGDFGTKIQTFGEAMGKFSASIVDIDSGKIDLAIDTATRIKDFTTTIVDLDDSGISIFTGALGKVGKAISTFGTNVADIDASTVSSSITAANRLKTFIVGLADFDASGIDKFKPQSIGDAMKKYAEKVAKFDFGTVTASITAANRLKTFIVGLADFDASGIDKFKPQIIGSSLSAYSSSVSNFNAGQVISSITAANRLKTFISGLAGFDASGVSSFKQAINELSTVSIAGVIEAFSAASAQLTVAGASMIDGLAAGMQSASSKVIGAATNIVMAAYKAITSKRSNFITAGRNLGAGLANGLSATRGSASSAASSVAYSAVSGARGNYSGMYSAGVYLGTGLINGIKSQIKAVYDAAYELGRAAVQGEKDGQQSSSPSKATIKAGKWLGEGLIIGIEHMGKSVYSASENMGLTAIDATRSAMATVLDALSVDMDSQPTIRPVIDLSDVQTGTNAIHSMFNGVQTIGVRSNLNAINVAMNNKLQNGVNSDIISAINKLGDGLENSRGDTYNFGDFTYDDGSNVAEAVGTLIRYAKIGRRV